jgi:hypothetical protein
MLCELPKELIEQVQSLMDAGKYHTAWRTGEAFAPLRNWTGLEARLLAVHVVDSCGGEARAHAMARLALSLHPDSGEALYQSIPGRLRTHGILDVLRIFDRLPDGPDPTDSKLTAKWLNRHACLRANLKDILTSERLLARAEEIYPGNRNNLVARGFCWFRNYDLEKALDLLIQAEKFPTDDCDCYAIWLRGKILTELGREEEALEYLSSQAPLYEDPDLYVAWADVLSILDRHQDSVSVLEESLRLLPLLPDPDRTNYLHRLAHAHLRTGAREEALRLLVDRDDPNSQRVVQCIRAAEGQPDRRLKLPVGYVLHWHTGSQDCWMAAEQWLAGADVHPDAGTAPCPAGPRCAPGSAHFGI